MAYYSTISGGAGNVIETNSTDSTIGGGSDNMIQRNAVASTISGCINNTIQSGAGSSVIGGGNGNTIRSNANYSVIAGGYNNTVQSNADYSVIIGGSSNTARDNAMYSVALGGSSNETGGDYTLAAGRRAKALHTGSFVWGDSQNSDFISTAVNQFLIRAAGGVGINTSSPQSGLDVNAISRFRQRVDFYTDVYLQDNDLFFRWDENHGLGWFGNTRPFASQTTIDGPVLYGWSGGALGSKNGGEKIALFWNYSQQLGIGTVSPSANLDISTGAGESAPQLRINQTSTSDSARLRFTADGNYGRRWDIAVRQTDFVIYSGYYGADMLKLDSSGLTVRGTLVSSSDKNLKENFQTVTHQSILEKLSELPIHTWNFKNDKNSKHIGPTAQDFYAAFKLGKDDKTIATVDADGVAFAAIKALKQIVDEQKIALDEKDRKVKDLEKRIETLEKLIEKINLK